MQELGVRRGKRRTAAAVAAVTAVAVLVAGGVAAYLLLRTKGSPQQTAASYLSAWQRGSYRGMAQVSLDVPHGGLAAPMRQVAADLGLRGIHLSLGQVTSGGGTAVARYTAHASLAAGHVWTYRGRLRLVDRNQHWRVAWSPAAIYPSLRAGERFSLSAVWPARAQILAADGTVLSSPAALAQSGSLELLTGNVVAATAAQARQLGAPYQAGDLIGQGGIEEAYQSRLAGKPALSIRITGPGSRVDATVARFGGVPGQPVRTSIDMNVQRAASAAVSSAATSKPVDLVAVQPSTGHVLAVVERPGGFDRALSGVFPPGSTFKIVTASALAQAGLRPGSAVQCPGTTNIGGRIFHNFDNEALGATTLQDAFAVSCNTTFANLATQRLSGSSLAAMAHTFGFNAAPSLGIPATLGHFTRPGDPVSLAADAFGQGTDLVNPLSMAGVAAAVEDGSWRPPLLVTDPAPPQPVPPHPLSATILNTLRPMMQAVVTNPLGTAAHVGFPPGVHGKTGTAEYGSGPNPPSHAWFVGYRGDLAFAVLVEGGGVGADASGPIANSFVRKA
jgi:hypothetical protein